MTPGNTLRQLFPTSNQYDSQVWRESEKAYDEHIDVRDHLVLDEPIARRVLPLHIDATMSFSVLKLIIALPPITGSYSFSHYLASSTTIVAFM